MQATLCRKFAAVVLFGATFVVPFALLSLRNDGIHAEGLDGLDQIRMILQKSPDTSELKSPAMAIAQIVHNVGHFGIYRISQQMLPGLWAVNFGWKGSGWFALALAAGVLLALWPVGCRCAYYGLDLVIWPMLLLSQLYAEGGSERYWVPTCVLLSVLVVIRLAARFNFFPALWRARIAPLIALAVLIPNLLAYMVRHERQPYSTNGPWEQLAELFEHTKTLPLQTQGVLTPNMHAFTLMTGYRAPMAVTRFNPPYDHMIARDDGKGPQPPTGSVPLSCQ